ncbi:MAG: hypothetical protein CVU38_02425 [Chloroflexi bacterium HGW-Chloroflexi-1]|nr:MAG: hypothetical protein CVU38_02425 [Chloroflexi bacterium HGW-Chloroflexi-1]
MADIIQANYESLAALAKRFAQQANKMRQMHSDLHRQMSLLRPAWVGKGSEAFFAELSDKVLPAVQRLAAALAEADRVTKQIEEVLRNAEEQAASPFRQDTGGGAAIGSAVGDAGGSIGGAGGDVGGDIGGGLGVGGTGETIGDFFANSGETHPIGDLGGGAGGAWDDGGFMPGDIDDARLDQIQNDYGYGSDGDFAGGGAGGGGLGGGAGDFSVPDDWLSGVDQAYGAGMGGSAGGGGLGDGMGGGAGAGMDSGLGGGSSGGGAPSGGGGDMGSGGGSPGGGGPSTGAGMSQPSGGGSPFGQGYGAGAGSQAAAALPPGPLRYQSIGGAGSLGAAVKATPASVAAQGGAGSGAAAGQLAAQANVGIPMGLAALSPFLALLGKAIKDKSKGAP